MKEHINNIEEFKKYATSYKFQWIRVREFRDLTKEIYIEYLYNPEGVKFNIFKPGW